MSTLSVESVPPPPSWLASISSTALVRVRPGPLVPVAAAVLTGLVWGSVAVVGLTRLSPVWVLLAVAAGVGALLLALRGNPAVALVPVLLAGVLWGLATGGLVPASPGDVLGDLRLLGWNVVFAVPLLSAYVAAVWVDARWQAYTRVRDAAATRRWWGADGGEPDRQLGLLEAIPAARFVLAADGTALVLAGRRVAVVRSATWPPGEYSLDGDEVRRDGRAFGPGSDDVASVRDDVAAWTGRLGATGVRCRGYVLVRAASDRPVDEVLIEEEPQPWRDGARPAGAGAPAGVRLVPEREFVEVVGGFLAVDPYRLDVEVLRALDGQLRLFS